MKRILLIAGGVLLAGVVVLLVALPSGPSWTAGYLERIRGQDAYYREDQRIETVGPLQVRLADPEEEWFMVLEFAFVYSPGLDFEDRLPDVEARRPRLLHELTLFLGEQQSGNLDGPTQLYRFKRSLRRLLDTTLFPEKEGRVDRLHFKTLLLQRH